ncbi:SIP domain-containing protein [Shinella sp. PSBB067]|uniref:SIP domain-containing protein n=1 Tax=Shinella sp. PSBB067 TaxID=2715959 RepID=UPI0021085097|nr:SIP domain-containing protein [Shinella sp. PSBB067]
MAPLPRRRDRPAGRPAHAGNPSDRCPRDRASRCRRGGEDELPCETQADLSVEWLHRGAAKPGTGTAILDRLAQLAFPPGRGQAYVVGETSNVRAQRHHLITRGFERGQIASEGYWRPGRIGGHDHVDD